MPTDSVSGVYYETHGTGIPLFLGFPIMASQHSIFGEALGSVRDQYLALLTDRYQVLIIDYPSIGLSRDIPPHELTADKVVGDFLSVADAAGFDQFIYWGYSWGGSAGLQLASRTDRIMALVVGGHPPLGAPYEAALRASLEQIDDPPPEVQVVLRSPAQYAQWSNFAKSIEGWPEREFAQRNEYPRMAFVGAEGDTTAGSEEIPNATILKANQHELESMGWQIRLIANEGHDVCMKPEVVVPVVREFLDAAVAR